MSIEIGIVCAVDEEFSALCEKITIDERIRLGGKSIVFGSRDGVRVVIIKAGIGNINSALATTLIISKFQPKFMLFSGIAGSLNPKLAIGDVLIGNTAFQAEAITHEQLRAFWTMPDLIKPADPSLLALANSIVGTAYPVKTGVIVSSDIFPAPKDFESLFKDKHAQAIDMETAAFYQTCNELATPGLCIRSFSNPVTNSEHEDLEEHNVAISSSNCSDFCFRLIDLIKKNKLVVSDENYESPADLLISQLKLIPHPEGGHYKRTYQSTSLVGVKQSEYESLERHAGTAIYYLLKGREFSAWHRIKSDETWFHHQGGTVKIHMIDPSSGAYQSITLGTPETITAATPQYTVKKNTWFSVSVDDPSSYALCGCSVTPGFDFKDFTLADHDDLTAKFPEHEKIISRYIHPENKKN
jgi:uncharacterized protein